MDTRTCTSCGKVKPLDEYHRNGDGPSGRRSRCKACRSVAWKTPERRERRRIANRKYHRHLRATNPKYRLTRAVSCNVRASIVGGKRGRGWESMVGYTLDDLVRHLEQQFTQGMTWDNYGEWHVDHIVPVSAFNYSTPEHVDFKRCWALDNLRPLWADENVKKSNSMDAPFQPSLQLSE